MSAFHPKATEQRTQFYVGFVPCVDVYGPRPIATMFGMFRIKGHNC
jgi:hypothetical protein